MSRLSGFEHRCFRIMSRIWCTNVVGDSEVRRKVSGPRVSIFKSNIVFEKIKMTGT